MLGCKRIDGMFHTSRSTHSIAVRVDFRKSIHGDGDGVGVASWAIGVGIKSNANEEKFKWRKTKRCRVFHPWDSRTGTREANTRVQREVMSLRMRIRRQEPFRR